MQTIPVTLSESLKKKEKKKRKVGELLGGKKGCPEGAGGGGLRA